MYRRPYDITFNDYIGKETLNREFKEFTFHNSDLNINNETAELYCRTGKFDFNQNVLFNLNKYILNYIPKYTCAFLNSNIDADFIIGVNDYGFIKGIPYNGRLPTYSIKTLINEVINENVMKLDNSNFNFRKHITVNIIKINKPPQVSIQTIPNEFITYLHNKEIYKREYANYVNNMEIWRNEMKKFTQKLSDLVNNFESRIRLIDYIKSYDPENPVIEILKTNYLFENKEYEQINILKNNPLHPCFWVCKWKDEMIELIKNQKPIFNNSNFISSTPINLINSVSDMIPFWLSNNTNLNLYVIKINFHSIPLYSIYNEYNERIISFYYKKYNNFQCKWISCYRNIQNNGEPECTPYLI